MISKLKRKNINNNKEDYFKMENNKKKKNKERRKLEGGDSKDELCYLTMRRLKNSIHFY
jgi:hypothetical protein